MAASGGFVASGRGNSNLQRLFEFTAVDEIKDLLLRVRSNPTLYGVSKEHIWNVPNEPKYTYNTNDRSSIDQAIKYVLTQMEYKGGHMQCAPPEEQTEVLYLLYNDAYFRERILPAQTIYDALGWILSLTAVPSQIVHNLDRFFYLPLLAVYGKWCKILTATAEERPEPPRRYNPEAIKLPIDPNEQNIQGNPVMAISWFSDFHEPTQVILSSTIGTNWYRSHNIIRVRQQKLLDREFQPDNPETLVDNNVWGNEYSAADDHQSRGYTKMNANGVAETLFYPKVHFGVCAETSFFLVAGRTFAVKELRGIAITTPTLRTMHSYDETLIQSVLVDPCSSCRFLIGQIRRQDSSIWEWQQTHRIAIVSKLITDARKAQKSQQGGKEKKKAPLATDISSVSASHKPHEDDLAHINV